MDEPNNPTSRPGVDKTLVKGLALLEALAETESSHGITDLAKQLALNKSNVHRLLQTLISSGYVAREPGTERYVLSPKLWRIARRGRPFDAMRRSVRPVLRNLVDTIHESVLFVIVQDDELIAIDQVETKNLLRVLFFTVGQSYPIHQVTLAGNGLTALQLIALAFRPESEARSASRDVQRQLNESAAFAKQQLTAITSARENGFAIRRDWVPGANAAAVPVTDPAGHLLGVLSCFGPADRLTNARLKRDRKSFKSRLARVVALDLRVTGAIGWGDGSTSLRMTVSVT